MNKKYNKGFSIYELIVVVAILAAASPFIYSLIGAAIERRAASQYSDFTKMYASKFIDEIKSNYGDYYELVTKDPDNNETIVIPFEKIENNVSKSLNWGIIPCVAIRYNPMSKDMQAIMFYTDNGTKAKHISQRSAIKAMNDFGIGSGYYESSGIVNGISGAWSLKSDNDYINKDVAKKCSTTTLTQNGLVINLNMLDSFPKVNSGLDAGYLSRVKDAENQAGTNDNTNTMQADIMMQNGKDIFGIFLSGNESSAKNEEVIFLGIDSSTIFKKVNKEPIRYSYYGSKEPSIAIYGGGLRAESFISMKEVDAYTNCSYNEYGSIVKQKKPSKSSTLFDVSPSYLTCINNEALCPNHSACYLPEPRSLHYTFARTDGKTSFQCPANMYVEPGSVVTDSLRADPIIDPEGDIDCFDGVGKSPTKVSGACSLIPYDTTIEYTNQKIITHDEYEDEGFLVRIIISAGVKVSNAKFFTKIPRDKTHIFCNCIGKTVAAGKNGTPTNTPSGVILGVTCTTNPTLQEDADSTKTPT